MSHFKLTKFNNKSKRDNIKGEYAVRMPIISRVIKWVHLIGLVKYPLNIIRYQGQFRTYFSPKGWCNLTEPGQKGCGCTLRFKPYILNAHFIFLKFSVGKLDGTSDARGKRTRLPVGDDFILLISRTEASQAGEEYDRDEGPWHQYRAQQATPGAPPKAPPRARLSFRTRAIYPSFRSRRWLPPCDGIASKTAEVESSSASLGTARTRSFAIPERLPEKHLARTAGRKLLA